MNICQSCGTEFEKYSPEYLCGKCKHDEKNVNDLGNKKNTTLVVNLFAGPGASKSTIASGIFNKLKWSGIRSELATEYCKDLVWEGRHETFRDQIYLFGKMFHRIFRLLDKVDVIVTDSPFLLTPIYDLEKREFLKKLCLEEHNKLWNLNIFINRKKPYDRVGRNQSEQEAIEIDTLLLNFLRENNIPYIEFDGYNGVEETITQRIISELEIRNGAVFAM